jgi:hypothetical protein
MAQLKKERFRLWGHRADREGCDHPDYDEHHLRLLVFCRRGSRCRAIHSGGRACFGIRLNISVP